MLDYGYPKQVKRIPHDVDAALYLQKNKKLIFIKVNKELTSSPHLTLGNKTKQKANNSVSFTDIELTLVVVVAESHPRHILCEIFT